MKNDILLFLFFILIGLVYAGCIFLIYHLLLFADGLLLKIIFILIASSPVILGLLENNESSRIQKLEDKGRNVDSLYKKIL